VYYWLFDKSIDDHVRSAYAEMSHWGDRYCLKFLAGIWSDQCWSSSKLELTEFRCRHTHYQRVLRSTYINRNDRVGVNRDAFKILISGSNRFGKYYEASILDWHWRWSFINSTRNHSLIWLICFDIVFWFSRMCPSWLSGLPVILGDVDNYLGQQLRSLIQHSNRSFALRQMDQTLPTLLTFQSTVSGK
jgi:hypothetical protein